MKNKLLTTLLCLLGLNALGQFNPYQHQRLTTNHPFAEISGVLRLDTTASEPNKLFWDPNIVGAVFPTNAYPIVAGTVMDMSPNPNHQYQYVLTNNNVLVTGFSGLSNTNVNYGAMAVSNSSAGSIQWNLPATAHYIGVNSTNAMTIPPGMMAWASVTIWGQGSLCFTDIVDNVEGGSISYVATQIYFSTNPIVANVLDASLGVQQTNCSANPTFSGVKNVPVGVEWHTVVYINANGSDRTLTVSDGNIRTIPAGGTYVTTNGGWSTFSVGGIGSSFTGAVFTPFPP